MSVSWRFRISHRGPGWPTAAHWCRGSYIIVESSPHFYIMTNGRDPTCAKPPEHGNTLSRVAQESPARPAGAQRNPTWGPRAQDGPTWHNASQKEGQRHAPRCCRVCVRTLFHVVARCPTLSHVAARVCVILFPVVSRCPTRPRAAK